MWQLLTYCIHTGTYLALQYLLIFKCVNVENKRRQLLAVTIVYSLVYSTIAFLLGSSDDYSTSITIQILYSVNHTINTFILLLIIAAGSSEFLPRNFLIATFYYDFLTLLPWPHKLLTGYMMKRFSAAGIQVSNSIYAGDPYSTLLVAINYIMLTASLWLVYLLFNRQFKRLIAKIPDYICALVMLITFLLYVCRSILEIGENNSHIRIKPYTEGSFPYLVNGLLTLSILIVVLLVIYTSRRAVIRRIQETEIQFRFQYYTNVTGIYSEVRHLRHDLANHMAAIKASGTETSYRDSLLASCKAISEKAAEQLAWQEIDLDVLSSREKFEIYQFAGLLAKKLKKDGPEFESDKDNGRLRINICDRHRSRLGLLLLKSRMEYRLIKAIARQHSGNTIAENTEEDGNKCIMLDLTL